MTRGRARAPLAGGAILMTLATAGLYVVSRGKWSDPIIDSGREWIVPDALAKGNLLYRDVVYWFGPFTPYFQAAFFRIFGSSLSTLVLAGAVASAGALAALYAALRTVTRRAEAALWTALAVPALVFMPNAGGGLLGMGYRIWHAATFSLASLALTARARAGRRLSFLAAAGALAGLAGLCRTEWGVTCVAAAWLSRAARARSFRAWAPEAGLIGAAFAVVFAGGVGWFVAHAGGDAVLRDGHVLLTGLPPETREFLIGFSGVRDWKTGLVQLLYSAAMWLGVFLVVDLAARPRPAALAARAVVPVGVVLAATAAAGGASGAVLFSAAPLVCAAALAVGLARRTSPRAAAAVGFAAAGLLASYRRPFHIGDSAYVAPPLLFAIASAAALCALAVSRVPRRLARVRLRTALRLALGLVVAVAFAGRALQYASDDRIAIPGTGGMLSARPDVARLFSDLSSRIRRETHPGDGVVAFPEGELVNYLADRPNPIRHKLYLPGYLNKDNESAVLEELERARPAAVVVWRRPTSEYGPGLFGEDYARRVRSWIDRNYVIAPAPDRRARGVLLGLRRGD